MRFFAFILISFFCSCNNSANNQHVSPKYVILADEIRNEVAKKLSKEFQMTPIGEGGSFYDCVREMFLAFDIQGPLTKDQLRSILVSCVEEFLSVVNSNEELRPYLKVYPFTSQEIGIRLFVRNKWGMDVYDPNIGVASARKGKLIYKTTDQNDTFKYKSTITESYDDALKIVNETSNGS